jgi:CDP-diacylglycerol--glycerol-3-phosphate 3-phosphatidyltransferase
MSMRGWLEKDLIVAGPLHGVRMASLMSPTNSPNWRRAHEKYVGILADRLAGLGARPNHITWLSVLPAFASLVFAARGDFPFAVLMMLFSGLCDMLDGAMARRGGKSTLFGALLDSTLDRFADAAPLLGLVIFWAGRPYPALIASLAAFAGYSVSYVRARAEGLQIALPPLWMRRTERLVLTGVGLLLAPLGVPGVETPAPATLLVTGLLCALSFAAAGHALLVAARITRDTPRQDAR